MVKVEVVLRNPEQPRDQISIWIEPEHSSLASRWVKMLKKTLRSNHALEKAACFWGWANSPRQLELLLAKLNETIEEINRYNERGHWDPPYLIEERCRADAITQAELNRLHSHFERLAGQVWNRSAYISNAGADGRAAIMRLNSLIHETEHLERAKALRREGSETFPLLDLAFFKIKGSISLIEELEDEDYERFGPCDQFGDVMLSYCQTGKKFHDAWKEEDEDIGPENVNNLRYYSGRCMIRFGKSVPRERTMEDERAFREWLRGKGFDVKDGQRYFLDSLGNKQGLGELKIGRLVPNQFGERDVAQIQDLVARHMDVYIVRVHEGRRVCEAVYPSLGGNALPFNFASKS